MHLLPVADSKTLIPHCLKKKIIIKKLTKQDSTMHHTGSYTNSYTAI